MSPRHLSTILVLIPERPHHARRLLDTTNKNLIVRPYSRAMRTLGFTGRKLPVVQEGVSVILCDLGRHAYWAEAARSIDTDPGLRCGEMIALEWNDVDLKERQMTIRRSAELSGKNWR